MHRRDRRLIAAAVVVAVAAVVAVVVLATRSSTPSTRKPQGVQADRPVKIKVDGASLSAELITPKASGRAPLLVIPGSWGGAAATYRLLAGRFARAGYIVLAYAQRGWGGSTGAADFAGAPTQRDAKAVITWALAHTRADPQRVGMLGISYGAGISLLTAAHDSRVRAVVAMSTWADMRDAFDPNGTPATAALQVLVGPGRTGTFDSTVMALRRTLTKAPQELGAELGRISPTRSPSTYVAELNRNRPAIMLANAFEDSVFPPQQLVPFYDALTTPKRLDLAPGDHGGPEVAALVGGTTPTVDDAQKWLDHYLRGVANGIDTRAPIALRDIGTGEPREFTKWPAVNEQIPLGAPGTTNTATTWSAQLQAGVDSAADNGPAAYFQASSAYRPPQIQLSAIDRQRALVWTGPPVNTPTAVDGTPAVHLTVAGSGSKATIYSYLYDVAPDGTATLFDMAPYTATGLTPGAPSSATFDMEATAYTVAAGHRVALVVDAADPRYYSLTPAGSTITVSSSSTERAAVDLPITR